MRLAVVFQLSIVQPQADSYTLVCSSSVYIFASLKVIFPDPRTSELVNCSQMFRTMKGLRRIEDQSGYKSRYHNYFYIFPELMLYYDTH